MNRQTPDRKSAVPGFVVSGHGIISASAERRRLAIVEERELAAAHLNLGDDVADEKLLVVGWQAMKLAGDLREHPGRRARRDWLIRQRTHIQSGSGAFAPPANPEESAIGVGRSLPSQEAALQERAYETALAFDRLRAARLALRPREQAVLETLCAGLYGTEAAEALGVTQNNYRQVVLRLRLKLKKVLPKE